MNYLKKTKIKEWNNRLDILKNQIHYWYKLDNKSGWFNKYKYILIRGIMSLLSVSHREGLSTYNDHSLRKQILG
jgi:hypothetical protein